MAVPGLPRLLVKNTSVQIAAQGVLLALGVASSIVLSRYLGIEGFGQYSYLFAFYYFFLAINDFGVNTIVVREVSQQRDRAGEIIGAMLSFKVVLALVSVGLAWTVAWMMELSDELRHALCVFALILPATALQLPTVIFQVLLKAEYPAVVGVVNRCLGFLLTMAVVWTGHGLTALAAVLVLSEFASLGLLLYLTRRWVRPVWRFAPALWGAVLRSSVPLGVAGLCVALINRADFIMLERMTDLHQLGLYSAAYKVTNLLETLPLMVMGTIYPVMAQYAKEDRGQLRQLYLQTVLGLGLVALPIGVLVTIGAPLIVRVIFGAQFVEAAPALRVLVWATVSLYLAIAGGNLLISMGREQTNLTLNLLGAVLNVSLNLWLIPTMGFVGAAFATTATFLFILAGISVAACLALKSDSSP